MSEEIVVPEYEDSKDSELSDAVPPIQVAGSKQTLLIGGAGVGVALLLVVVVVASGGDDASSPAQGGAAQPYGGPSRGGPSWPPDWLATASARTTADERPISELAQGTRGEACAGGGGTVASTNSEATQAGLAVLAAGGNAAGTPSSRPVYITPRPLTHTLVCAYRRSVRSAAHAERRPT